MVYTLRFFPLRNAVCFIILTYLVPVLFTFYIQGVLKLKKNNSGAKRLIFEAYTALFSLPEVPVFFVFMIFHCRILQLYLYTFYSFPLEP